MSERKYSDRQLLRDLQRITDELTGLTREMKLIVHPPLYFRVRFWACAAAAMTFNLGVVLLLGGPVRVAASAYRIIYDYGGPFVYGSAFVGTAIITALCAWKAKRFLSLALLMQAVPYAAFSISFAMAAFRYSDANLTAAPIYAWIAIMHAVLSTVARKEL